jgi:hypothetical protein
LALAIHSGAQARNQVLLLCRPRISPAVNEVAQNRTALTNGRSRVLHEAVERTREHKSLVDFSQSIMKLRRRNLLERCAEFCVVG